ncbi:MAG TPA: DNA polymerase III subunit epsilon [Stellaceae bacterium]|nr:DNA polymerase III subunit epsilon [Stellaceae bacterium]
MQSVGASGQTPGMREIVLDTETTGLDPAAGHRIIEIACVELMNHVATGRVFHSLVDPEREVTAEAFEVHGISTDALKGKPRFAEIAGEFLDFVAGDPLVIHNAEFDLGFVNMELGRCELPGLDLPCVDTVLLARKRFPGSSASLDALCRRFAIDLSQRRKHGALLDAELLAAVYLELIGGRQPGLEFLGDAGARGGLRRGERQARPPRPHAPSAEEIERHRAFLAKLKTPLWTAED